MSCRIRCCAAPCSNFHTVSHLPLPMTRSPLPSEAASTSARHAAACSACSADASSSSSSPACFWRRRTSTCCSANQAVHLYSCSALRFAVRAPRVFGQACGRRARPLSPRKQHLIAQRLFRRRAHPLSEERWFARARFPVPSTLCTGVGKRSRWGVSWWGVHQGEDRM